MTTGCLQLKLSNLILWTSQQEKSLARQYEMLLGTCEDLAAIYQKALISCKHTHWLVSLTTFPKAEPSRQGDHFLIYLLPPAHPKRDTS